MAAQRALVVDAELRRLSGTIERSWLEVYELAEEVRREGYHARFGFADPEAYLETRCGLAYRSLAKRKAVAAALTALPAADQAEAREKVAALGANKAATLAPALRSDPVGWRHWVATAAEETVDRLQDRVSRTLGLKPRGAQPPAPGARFLAMVLNQCPPEARDEVAEVFALGGRIAGTDNAVMIFLHMCHEVRVEWAHKGGA